MKRDGAKALRPAFRVVTPAGPLQRPHRAPAAPGRRISRPQTDVWRRRSSRRRIALAPHPLRRQHGGIRTSRHPAMTPFALSVLSHTPVWVWALLALLVALGLQQMRAQIVTRRRLLALPAGLAIYSLIGLLQTFGGHASSLLPWLAGAALGFALNRLWKLPRQVQALPDGRFRLGGSALPLTLFMVIFLLRYVLAVALNIEPDLAHAQTLVLPACLLMGLSVGLLAARAWRVLGNAPRRPAAVAA
jgi:hypothetical protein